MLLLLIFAPEGDPIVVEAPKEGFIIVESGAFRKPPPGRGRTPTEIHLER